MDKVTVKITGTIPTAQYANLQPEIEAQGKSYEEAQELALSRMKDIWNRVCEPGKELTIADRAIKSQPTQLKLDELKCSVSGTKVMFDSQHHAYFYPDGSKYLSGSAFSGKYVSKFQGDAISAKVASKHKVGQQDILDMWALNAQTSCELGNAVHNALELYGKYLGLSKKIKGTNESALSKNPVIRPIVEKFFDGREDERAGYEVFVADEKHGLCGSIDRLLILDEKAKTCRIQDYKTNHDINQAKTIKKPFKEVIPKTTLGSYWLQLSFYAFIMQQHGWKVEGLDIFNWTGKEWKHYESEVVDISSEVKKG